MKEQCLLILYRRYFFTKQALGNLTRKTTKSFLSGNNFVDEQLQYLNLVYFTDKYSALFCEKGQKSSKEDGHVVIVACALVNCYSDTNTKSIKVNYIATKY